MAVPVRTKVRTTLTSLIDQFAPRIVVQKHYRPITPWFNAACRCGEKEGAVVSNEYNVSPSQQRIAQTGRVSSDLARYSTNKLSRLTGRRWSRTVLEMPENSGILCQLQWDEIEVALLFNRIYQLMLSRSFTTTMVGDVRSSTAGAASPEYSAFHGRGLDEFSQLSVANVVRLVNDFHPRRAASLDPIPTWLVKQLNQFLAPFLTNPFQQVVVTGISSRGISSGRNHTYILKKSSLDPAVLGNYRPISNLPFVSKVLERAVNERMLVHLQTNGSHAETSIRLIDAVIRPRLPSWRWRRTPCSLLIRLGKLTLLGMLDLSAAFDCVDHDILLNRLEKLFGFFGMAIGWIGSTSLEGDNTFDQARSQGGALGGRAPPPPPPAEGGVPPPRLNMRKKKKKRKKKEKKKRKGRKGEKN